MNPLVYFYPEPTLNLSNLPNVSHLSELGRSKKLYQQTTMSLHHPTPFTPFPSLCVVVYVAIVVATFMLLQLFFLSCKPMMLMMFTTCNDNVSPTCVALIVEVSLPLMTSQRKKRKKREREKEK